MQAKRYIGIDLHRNCFTACLRLKNGREYLKQWKLEDIEKFTSRLRPTDELAVEVTGNTRLFHDAVTPHVGRMVAVNPSQFKVIMYSAKKTDANDARNLALYLAKDLLPEVRMKDKTRAQIASLTQTRDSMVRLRPALKNKVNNICSAHGVNLNKESLSSEKGLRAVLQMPFDSLVNLELKIIVDQIRSLNESIAELEETIGKESQKPTTEVFVELKVPPQVVFTEAGPSVGNYVRFRLNPQVAIAIGARAKQPGEAMAGHHVELLVVEQPAEMCVGDYERLLGDAIVGDTTLFARQDLVETAWAIVDPLLADPGPMFEYEPGSWGPPQADRLVAEIGGWNTPQ